MNRSTGTGLRLQFVRALVSQSDKKWRIGIPFTRQYWGIICISSSLPTVKVVTSSTATPIRLAIWRRKRASKVGGIPITRLGESFSWRATLAAREQTERPSTSTLAVGLICVICSLMIEDRWNRCATSPTQIITIPETSRMEPLRQWSKSVWDPEAETASCPTDNCWDDISPRTRTLAYRSFWLRKIAMGRVSWLSPNRLILVIST